jgi:hypothetical protein
MGNRKGELEEARTRKDQMLSTAELVTQWVNRKALWEAAPTLKLKVETTDVRRAFGRIDVRIRPLDNQGTGQGWVDSASLEILE